MGDPRFQTGDAAIDAALAADLAMVAPMSPDQTNTARSTQMQKWYLGSMNDGLFIINMPPRPSTDDQFHERDDGPSMVINVSGMDPQLAYEIVSAHNLSLLLPA